MNKAQQARQRALEEAGRAEAAVTRAAHAGAPSDELRRLIREANFRRDALRELGWRGNAAAMLAEARLDHANAVRERDQARAERDELRARLRGVSL